MLVLVLLVAVQSLVNLQRVFCHNSKVHKLNIAYAMQYKQYLDFVYIHSFLLFTLFYKQLIVYLVTEYLLDPNLFIVKY